MMIPAELLSTVSSDPEILGGDLCFVGTRVPLATFIDHMEAGYSVERFLQGYPSVRRNQAMAVLEWLGRESRRTIGLELAS